MWLRPPTAASTNQTPITPGEIREAEQRLARFRPVLAALFPGAGWDGRIRSQLLDYPRQPDPPASPKYSRPADLPPSLEHPRQASLPPLLVKADHDLPMTGSVKARGGVYELLCRIESLAVIEGLVKQGEPLTPLLSPAARSLFSKHRIVVASTGNLGFSIGLVARAFGLEAEVHMSHDAKTWKKDRLRRTGANVIEHPRRLHGNRRTSTSIGKRHRQLLHRRRKLSPAVCRLHHGRRRACRTARRARHQNLPPTRRSSFTSPVESVVPLEESPQA